MIYAAIAIMWAVVLIPMWLRNHDTAAENRSAERFGQAMRVLSRKEQTAADEIDDAPPVERESAPAPAPARASKPRVVRVPRSRLRPAPPADQLVVGRTSLRDAAGRSAHLPSVGPEPSPCWRA